MNIKAHIRELEARLEKKAGHDLWTCFVKAPNFHEAKKQAEKKLDYALMHDNG